MTNVIDPAWKVLLFALTDFEPAAVERS